MKHEINKDTGNIMQKQFHLIFGGHQPRLWLDLILSTNNFT
jgi:hypothetical protein